MATTNAKRSAAFVSPDPQQSHLSDRMKVPKDIVDELLLVCGVIGTTTEGEELVPVTDCLNWLQDLQRALRRDDDLYRPISLLLSQWKIVEHKLLPLVLTSRFDPAIVLTVCKILVILTKPLSDQTMRAGRRPIHTKPKQTKGAARKATNTGENTKEGGDSIDITKEDEEEQQEEVPAKKRATIASKAVFERVKKEQINIRNNAIQQADALVRYKQAICNHPHQTKGDGVPSIFVSLLAAPLSRTGNARTDADHLTIEVILHLFRNLLAADPLIKTPQSEKLHHEFIVVLQRELVLDILLVLAADIERRENAQYNLLLMELLQHLLRHQDPTMVAQSQQHIRPASGALLGSLNRQRNAMKSQATSRHSHFGGTLVVVGTNGKRLLNAGRADQTETKAPIQKRQKEIFVGASHRADNQSRSRLAGPTEQASAKVIHSFCKQFMESCYGPVMKSLKNEFRRDSVRLEDGDHVVFFRIAFFFCQWWRASKDNSSEAVPAKNGLTVGHLVYTMDLFTFNLVLNATDTYTEHKKYPSLAQAVALLSEMMHVLHAMFYSKVQTEKLIALGLMENLFYNNEPLDRLPKLLSRWSPGIGSRDYLCDLLHITHVTLQILDSFSLECKVKKSDDSVTMAKKKANAAHVHVPSYFAKKIVSNLSVTAFTHLLASYTVNSPTVNHRLVSFFTRLSKHVVSVADTPEDGLVNPLAARTATYEPILYSYPMLKTLSTILNDTAIRKDEDYAAMLQFASTLVYSFAVRAKKNPMLFVELLLKHPLPHRYCESVSNMYVNEDIRLMVERNLLLDRHRNLDEKAAALRRGDDESSDEEIEFDGGEEEPSLALAGVTDKEVSVKRKDPPKSASDSSDEDDHGAPSEEQERKTKKQKKDEERRKQMKALDASNDASSDEDELGGTLAISKPTKGSRRAILWDSDDD